MQRPPTSHPRLLSGTCLTQAVAPTLWDQQSPQFFPSIDLRAPTHLPASSQGSRGDNVKSRAEGASSATSSPDLLTQEAPRSPHGNAIHLQRGPQEAPSSGKFSQTPRQQLRASQYSLGLGLLCRTHPSVHKARYWLSLIPPTHPEGKGLSYLPHRQRSGFSFGLFVWEGCGYSHPGLRKSLQTPMPRSCLRVQYAKKLLNYLSKPVSP